MSASRSPEEQRAWQRVRHVVLERDGYRCRDCEAPVERRELDVHHLIRRVDDGRDEASNCIALCDGCHAARHPNLQVSLSRRSIERWALRLAQWLDRTRELPSETRALNAALRLFETPENRPMRFRDGQLDAVLAALRGESLLVVRPTGGGKSLCFQLPAVLKGQPTTIVLSPLKALMVDQVAALQRRKLPATFINSDIGHAEKQQRFALLERGALSFLYVAPERFNPERVRPEEIARLTRVRPSFLVVDEAHLVDRWGDDFRIDYSRIAEIRTSLGEPPVLAFTATAGARAQQRIKDSLGIPEARTLVSDIDRPNIALIRMTESSDAARARIVSDLVANLSEGRAMVFVPTTNVGRKVQEALRAAGCELPLYHGKLDAAEREGILGRFSGTLEPRLNAVLCTSAFSMGLDVPDVRAVINWQHPAAVEDYLQEFGRGGRDGEPALALLFRDNGKESGLLHWMAEKTAADVVAAGKRTPEQAQLSLYGKRERIDEMARLAHKGDRCFRAELNEALAGPPMGRSRPWALRVLHWVFARRTHVRANKACCDVCNPELAGELRAGRYAPAGDSRPAVRTRSVGNAPPRQRRAPRLGSARQALAGAGAAIAASAVAAGGVLALRSDDSAIARASFERYTGAFAEPGEFAAPTSMPDGTLHRVCAHHVSDGSADDGRYTLCLLVDPSRAAGKRVIGGFKDDDERGRHGCYGGAESRAYCD